MSLNINTNLASIRAQRDLSTATGRLAKNFARLSSGLRISSSSDDAAGLAISERMRARIVSMDAAMRNANDGISLVQTAEGALHEISGILVRLRELSVQSRNGTLSNSDRTVVDNEFQALITEISRVTSSTEFNGVTLLDGSTSLLTLQVGIGTDNSVDRLAIPLTSLSASALGLSGLSVAFSTSVDMAITTIDLALDKVNSYRGSLGAFQNRLESTVRSLQVSKENLSAAKSRIKDVDVAHETADLTRNLILQQSAAAILAQANSQPELALSLLSG